MRRAPGPRALSTVEATISLVIVGVMLVASLRTVGAAARARVVRAERATGATLAQELMAEVLAGRFEEPDLSTSAELELRSFLPASATSNDNIWAGRWQAQYFKPALPPDTTSWRVTRVELRARVDGQTSGLFEVRLHEALADRMPGPAVIDRVTVAESDLPATVAWHSIDFPGNASLSPGDGLCVALTTSDTASPIRFEWESGATALPDAGHILGDGTTWTSSDPNTYIIMRIHGTYSTPLDTDALGPELPEDAGLRADWDDVDDYHLWAQSPPLSRDGAPIVEAGGWARQVTVEHVDPATLQPVGTKSGLKLVHVTAIAPSGQTFQATALRCESGAQEQPFAFDTTLVTDVEIALQLADDRPAEAAVTLVNHVLGAP